MREQSEAVSPRAVVRLIDLLRAVVDDVKEGGDPRLPLELALVKVSRPANELALEALDQRLEQLESNGASPAPPKPSPAAAPSPPVTAAAPAPTTAAEPAPPAEPEPGRSPSHRRRPRPSPRLWPSRHAGAGERALVGGDRARDRAPLVPLHSLVQSARPVSYENGTLVLGLTASKAFAKSIIEAPQNLQTISDVVGRRWAAARACGSWCWAPSTPTTHPR
jgi:DNA polymerase-3 subunit gamma/tau